MFFINTISYTKQLTINIFICIFRITKIILTSMHINYYLIINKTKYLLKHLNYFFKKYIYTINHKKIALNYLYFSLFSGLVGTFLATMIRFELASPGSHFFKGDSIRYLQIITLHALIMIFFVVIPIFFGFFANFFIPYHVGSKDVAFPRLNSLGFWIIPSSFLLVLKLAILRPQLYKKFDVLEKIDNPFHQIINKSIIETKKVKFEQIIFKKNFDFDNLKSIKLINTNLFDNKNLFNYKKNYYNNFSYWKDLKSIFFVKCPNSSFTMTGWTYITPFSSKLDYSGFGAVDLSIMAILLTGIASTLSLTNLLITRRILSMPGLKNRKSILPFMSISLFLVMRMLSLVTPVLAAAMIMLLSDRHLKTSFFDYAYGGDVVLFNHLFWFFGHPEVYVVIIPAFGLANMLIPFYSGKLLISKNHLIWATYAMGYMGFLVWGHHMYLVGLDHRARSLFSTITIMISLPAVIKTVNWLLTFVNGYLKINIPTLFMFSFILFFLSGGLTGLWLSHVSLNVYIHDTFYVVAHFHFMFSASVFSTIFGAIFHYYYTIFGYYYNRKYAYLMLIFWNLGQWMTFLPLYWVGYNGLPRRYHDYNEMYMIWHTISTHGHIFTLMSLILFFLILIESSYLKITKNYFSVNNLRLNKRINYYLVKIKLNKLLNIKLKNNLKM